MRTVLTYAIVFLAGCATTRASARATASVAPRTTPANVDVSAPAQPAPQPQFTDAQRLAEADRFFAQFIERADGAPAYRDAVARATQHRCNIEAAMRYLPSSSESPAPAPPAQCGTLAR